MCFHRYASGFVILAIYFLNTKYVQDIVQQKQYAPILNSPLTSLSDKSDYPI